jgi:hypothetical protein
MGYISTAEPFSYEWAVQHMAYDQGRWDAALAESDEVKGRDRDETRRLLYMAMYASRTERYNLVGTLVNALAHHGSGLDADEVGQHVLAAVEGGDDSWVRAQIERLTTEDRAAG